MSRAAHNQTSSRRKPVRGFRLFVERLEDRTVPAFFTPVNYPNAGSDFVLDCNNDGIDDLVGNTAADAISVSLGNGDGTFQTPLFTNGQWWYISAAGDFNNDGNVDLATSSAGGFLFNDVQILLGQGDGSFQGVASYNLESGLNFFVAAGDLNQDGFDDLLGSWDFSDGDVVAGYRVMISNGDGTFTHLPPVLDYGIGYWPNLADFNEDGLLDFVRDGSYWEGNGDGTFTFITGDSLGSTIADFNNDGNLDTCSSRYDESTVEVRLGIGNGNFGAALSFPTPHHAQGAVVRVNDVNADGRPDLLLGTDLGLTVLLGNGNGAFAEPTNLSIPIGSFVVSDFNSDAFADLATTPWNFSNPTQVYLNDHDWTSQLSFPLISISDTSIMEGNTGIQNITFLVSLSHVGINPTTVHYSTSNGTANAGSDYSAASGTVTFSPSQTSQTITIPILGDRLGEANETFSVYLSQAVNGVIIDNLATGTIVDNEPHVTITDVSLAEGKKGKKTSFNFIISLSRSYDQAVTLSYRTVNGTATTSSGDYDANTGSVTFSPGQTQKSITITVNGDNSVEAAETFFAELYNLSSNAWFDKYRGLGTILNDD